jgi:hypothetical protein
MIYGINRKPSSVDSWSKILPHYGESILRSMQMELKLNSNRIQLQTCFAACYFNLGLLFLGLESSCTLGGPRIEEQIEKIGEGGEMHNLFG